MPKAAFVPSTPLRALTTFDETLPEGHATFRVDDDGSDPHLKTGEYAVIDTTDRELQAGELYLQQSDCGGRERSIVQVQIDTAVELESDASETVWTTHQLRGFRKVGQDAELGLPLFDGLIGGWYSTMELEATLLGRVVGVSMNPLGNLLASSAGYLDEDAHNAAFDECEYLDVLIDAGYRPGVLRRRDGSRSYIEWNPRPRDQAKEARVLAMMTKRRAASTADDRIVAECARRGLFE